jgi:hypothetical protein
MSGPIDDALHTPQVLPIIRSTQPDTPEKESEEEGINMDVETIIPDQDAFASAQIAMKSVDSSDLSAASEEKEATQVEDTKKFVPLIQLPNGKFLTLMGEPIQPTTVPSVVIPSTFVNSVNVSKAGVLLMKKFTIFHFF